MRSFLIATVFAQDIAILIALSVIVIMPKDGRKQFLWLGLALLFGFLTDASSMISYYLFNRSANTIITIGLILSNASYLLFYRSEFKSSKIRALIIGLLVLNEGFALINMFFIQGVGNTTSYSFIIKSITFIIISLLYFYTLISELPTESITKLPMFWINTAFLLYYSGVFFQWLLMDYLINQLKGDVVNTYTIKNALGIIHYLFIAVGLWYNRTLLMNTSKEA